MASRMKRSFSILSDGQQERFYAQVLFFFLSGKEQLMLHDVLYIIMRTGKRINSYTVVALDMIEGAYVLDWKSAWRMGLHRWAASRKKCKEHAMYLCLQYILIDTMYVQTLIVFFLFVLFFTLSFVKQKP